MNRLIPHKRKFEDYAKSFFCGDRETNYNLDLKLRHSLRVLDNACEIIDKESFEPVELEHDIRLAALYHDLGRFMQFSRYKTYKDADSVNHGSFGAAILSRGKFLQGESKSTRKNVLGAVALHNRAFLPENLKGGMRTATLAVRDADKIDIVRVLIEHFRQAGDRETNAVLMNLEPSPDYYSENIFLQVYNQQPVDYSEMRWVNDFKLFVLSWAYQLNFGTALAMFKSRKYADDIFAILPDNREMKDLRRKLNGI